MGCFSCLYQGSNPALSTFGALLLDLCFHGDRKKKETPIPHLHHDRGQPFLVPGLLQTQEQGSEPGCFLVVWMSEISPTRVGMGHAGDGGEAAL